MFLCNIVCGALVLKCLNINAYIHILSQLIGKRYQHTQIYYFSNIVTNKLSPQRYCICVFENNFFFLVHRCIIWLYILQRYFLFQNMYASYCKCVCAVRMYMCISIIVRCERGRGVFSLPPPLGCCCNNIIFLTAASVARSLLRCLRLLQ